MAKKEKKPVTYTVDWLTNGFCYRTTVGVPKDELKNYRATAKLIGDTLRIEKEIYQYDTA